MSALSMLTAGCARTCRDWKGTAGILMSAGKKDGGGLLSRFFGRTDYKQQEEEIDYSAGFAENGGEFELSKLRKLVDTKRNMKELRLASDNFRKSLAADDIDAAVKHLGAFIALQEKKADDTSAVRMMRALYMKMDDPTKYADLIFVYLDNYSCDNPLGRNLCKAIVENNMLEGFETFVRENRSPQEVAERAQFYGELEKNFIKHISS